MFSKLYKHFPYRRLFLFHTNSMRILSVPGPFFVRVGGFITGQLVVTIRGKSNSKSLRPQGGF
jgi:hypothetical protein